MTLHYKIITLFTLVLLLTGMAQPARASESQPDPLLAQHYLLELIEDFELYQSGRGKSGLNQQLQHHLQRFRFHFDPLLQAASGLPEQERTDLTRHWQQVARNFSAWLVGIEQGGFVDQEITYQYREQMTALWNRLYDITVSHIALQNREKLMLLLQQANLRYLNPDWKLAPHEQDDLASMTQQADSLIQGLRLTAAEQNTVLQQKWPVLRQGLLQEDRAMEFIVKRYSGDLVSLLLQR